MPIFKGFKVAEDQFQFLLKVCRKYFNTDQQFGTYPIVKLSNCTLVPNFKILGHLRGLKMTVSEAVILHDWHIY